MCIRDRDNAIAPFDYKTGLVGDKSYNLSLIHIFGYLTPNEKFKQIINQNSVAFAS